MGSADGAEEVTNKREAGQRQSCYHRPKCSGALAGEANWPRKWPESPRRFAARRGPEGFHALGRPDILPGASGRDPRPLRSSTWRRRVCVIRIIGSLKYGQRRVTHGLKSWS